MGHIDLFFRRSPRFAHYVCIFCEHVQCVLIFFPLPEEIEDDSDCSMYLAEPDSDPSSVSTLENQSESELEHSDKENQAPTVALNIVSVFSLVCLRPI